MEGGGEEGAGEPRGNPKQGLHLPSTIERRLKKPQAPDGRLHLTPQDISDLFEIKKGQAKGDNVTGGICSPLIESGKVCKALVSTIGSPCFGEVLGWGSAGINLSLDSFICRLITDEALVDLSQLLDNTCSSAAINRRVRVRGRVIVQVFLVAMHGIDKPE